MSKWQLFGYFMTIYVVKTDIQALLFITIKTKQVKYCSGSLILVSMNAKKIFLNSLDPEHWRGVYDFIFELQRTYLPRPHDKMIEFFLCFLTLSDVQTPWCFITYQGFSLPWSPYFRMRSRFVSASVFNHPLT